MTTAERQQLIRSEFQQEALPSAPAIPGFHTCWLSTTSSYDPIHKRMRMGYTPVSADDVPGMEASRMKSGEFAGMITCNEMALFKIPTEVYLEIMNEFHHNIPMESEATIKEQMKNLLGGHKSTDDRPVDELEGFGDLAERRQPQFAP